MREIEFRGKALDDDKFFKIKKDDWIFGNYSYDKLTNKYYIEDTTGEDIKTIEVITESIGQYTGLCDKKGTKIFEGDIVRVTIKYEDYDWDGQYKKHTNKLIGKVVYEKNAFVIDSKTRSFDFIDKQTIDVQRDSTTYYYTYEVTGNIHDNPELLGVKDVKN